MGEWREQQLCELVDISSSKRIFYNEYVSVGIPFYRSKEIIEKITILKTPILNLGGLYQLMQLIR